MHQIAQIEMISLFKTADTLQGDDGSRVRKGRYPVLYRFQQRGSKGLTRGITIIGFCCATLARSSDRVNKATITFVSPLDPKNRMLDLANLFFSQFHFPLLFIGVTGFQLMHKARQNSLVSDVLLIILWGAFIVFRCIIDN